MVDTCTRHDDYETFAVKYLGVDYEDFVNLQLGSPKMMMISLSIISMFLGDN